MTKAGRRCRRDGLRSRATGATSLVGFVLLIAGAAGCSALLPSVSEVGRWQDERKTRRDPHELLQETPGERIMIMRRGNREAGEYLGFARIDSLGGSASAGGREVILLRRYSETRKIDLREIDWVETRTSAKSVTILFCLGVALDVTWIYLLVHAFSGLGPID